jgi:UrcA family protein
VRPIRAANANKDPFMRLLALIMPLLIASVPATAGTMHTKSVAISHADLDLSNDAGRATLARRIAMAARHVCGTADARDIQGMADRNRCLVDARETATESAARVAAKAVSNQVAGL